jgi:hypothetical protein
VALFRAGEGFGVGAFKSLHFEDQVVMALKASIHFVKTILLNESVGKKLSKFMLGISIGIESHVKICGDLILEIIDKDLCESHVLWLLDHLFALGRSVLLVKWIPDSTIFTH